MCIRITKRDNPQQRKLRREGNGHASAIDDAEMFHQWHNDNELLTTVNLKEPNVARERSRRGEHYTEPLQQGAI